MIFIEFAKNHCGGMFLNILYTFGLPSQIFTDYADCAQGFLDELMPQVRIKTLFDWCELSSLHKHTIV